MPRTPMGRKMVWWIVSAVAALAVLGAGWALTAGRDGSSGGPGGGLFSGTGANGGEAASGGGTQTTTPASESATKTGGSGGGPTTPGGTAKPGGSTAKPGGSAGGDPGTPGGGSAPSTPEGARGTFVLRVAWWNDTESRPPTGFVIKWGTSGSWSPDSARRSQIGTIGPFVVGSAQSFQVYPDGTRGESITVPILITADMVSGSEQDGVHVEVRDYNVRALGNPVENTEIVLARP